MKWASKTSRMKKKKNTEDGRNEGKKVVATVTIAVAYGIEINTNIKCQVSKNAVKQKWDEIDILQNQHSNFK